MPQSVKPNRIAFIDGIRAFSILSVVILHSVYLFGEVLPRSAFAALISPFWVRPILQGNLGVDAFFVLSGFLIGDILMKEWSERGSIDLRRFYLRRFWRLFPIYFVVMCLTALVSHRNIENLWANLVYVNNYLPMQEQFMPWTWSLAIEEQFYLLCPFALAWLLSSRRPERGLWLLFTFAFLLVGAAMHRTGLRLPSPFHPVLDADGFHRMFDLLYDKTELRFGALLVGIIVAYYARFTPALELLRRRPRLVRGLGALALATLLCSMTVTPFESYWSAWPSLALLYQGSFRYLFALAIGWLIMQGLVDKKRKTTLVRVLSWSVWRPIAQISYSGYLLHILWLHLGLKLLLPHRVVTTAMLPLYIPVATVFALALSAPFYYGIERPILRWRDRQAFSSAGSRRLAPKATK